MSRRAEGVTFVVMAGGKGERLWPLVRAAMPKVCLAPAGGRSLIQQTIDRLKPVWPSARWLIVTSRGQEGPIRRALARRPPVPILVEPEGRNTAACIALAAFAVAAESPRRIMAAVPADHWMGDLPAFQRAMRAAIEAARRYDALVTIGIRPRAPLTGLGYICARQSLGARNGRGPRLLRIARFIEKPRRAVAQRLVRQPGTFWNSGMFIGRAEVFLERLTQWLPEHVRRLAPLAGALRHRQMTRYSLRRLATAYRRLKPISFDHGVMQHLTDSLVVDGRFAWEDLGSWDMWAQPGRLASRAVLIDSDNVRIVGDPGHLIAAIGIRDLLLVHTPTATLLCDPARAQDVRHIVERLAAHPHLAAYL
ncbi:MAG: mannose-1-phosphate guanylyltransferase [Candidatus Omnitrophica bacterium]|nr:mannose-1-phosphate guanylyltransferase [Candidatus Omnitrophota bacterium]